MKAILRFAQDDVENEAILRVAQDDVEDEAIPYVARAPQGMLRFAQDYRTAF